MRNDDDCDDDGRRVLGLDRAGHVVAKLLGFVVMRLPTFPNLASVTLAATAFASWPSEMCSGKKHAFI